MPNRRLLRLNFLLATAFVCVNGALPAVAEEASPALRPNIPAPPPEQLKQMRHNRGAANTLAKYHWLDKAIEANSNLLDSVTAYHSASKILVKHPRLGEIAEADHYLCRRLTQYKDVARMLAASPYADKVIALDPEGIYRAVKKDRVVAKKLAKNPMFHNMIGENPDLGRLISTYM